MHRTLATIAAFALALAVVESADAAAKQCRDAQGKFIKCPPTASAPALKPPKHCDKGKPCGNTCIAKDKVCHVK